MKTTTTTPYAGALRTIVVDRRTYEITVVVTVDDMTPEAVEQWARRLIDAAMRGSGATISPRLVHPGESARVTNVEEVT